MEQKHKPVLLGEILDYLKPKKGDRYLDVTAGYGGHAEAILAKTLSASSAVLVDRDEVAIRFLKEERFARTGAVVLHQDFLGAVLHLKDEQVLFDLIVADFGVSSPHLDQASRGFSFQTNGPLDMRMDQTQKLTAAEIVNTWSLSELEQILRSFGEEPKARKFARQIVDNRPFTTTLQLASLLEKVAGRRGKTHPATRTFQALRIATNDELGQIKNFLNNVLAILAPAGRLGIITFQSLEDRLVKDFIRDHAGDRYDAELTVLTKKPVVSGKNELVNNPRARSAKLRAVVKK